MSQLSFQLPWPESFSEANLLQLLNANQRAAVQFRGQPLAIIAGAGTGKTRVITHRIAHLIATHDARPQQILALTFTDKAAAEMQERIDQMLPYGLAEVAISTFHSFGDNILREFAIDLGLAPDFRLLSPPEQALFLHEHLFELPLHYYRPLSNPNKFLHDLLRYFSRLKDEDTTPEEYLAYAENRYAQPHADAAARREAEKQLELARCYKAYQTLMAQNGCVDFGDQIALSIRLLREHPDIRRRLQERFQYVLVDEFQDTNYAQFQLVKELVAPHLNLTVVADDDQAIYKFRGAAISNILNFRATYPNAQTIVLTENYRCTQQILDAAYRLIRHNDPDRLEAREQIDKRLTTTKTTGVPVAHWHFDTLDAEAEQIAQTIVTKVQNGERRLRDFCVLVRSNNAAEAFLRAFEAAGVPYRFSGNRGLFQRTEIRLLLAFMRGLANPRDDQSFYQLAQSEIYRVPMADLQQCLYIHQTTHRSLLNIFKHLASYEWEEPLSPEGMASLAKLVADHASYLELSRSTPTYALLYNFLKQSGYLAQLTRDDALEGDQTIRNLAKFFTTVRRYEHFTEPGDLAFFVRHLDLLREFGDDPATAEADSDDDAVQVMTVHKAKGLEFPVVFVVGLVEQQFPTRKRSATLEVPEDLIKDKLPQGEFHLQEERRLFYVALTRAQDELYLSSAEDYGTKQARKTSGFVYEALGTIPQHEGRKKTSPHVALARNAATNTRPEIPRAARTQNQHLTLDPHKIDDYLSCPLKYKYRHVLRVPFPPSHTLIYGEAMHAAIREYLERKRKQLPVAREDLLRAFHAKWRSFGFFNREHETMRKTIGEQALERFFEQQEQQPHVPAYIEEAFSLRLENLTITGRWDRVDEFPDGRVIITDYKSSEVTTAEEAHSRVTQSRQLRLYAWSYEERFNRPVYAWRLHFLESGLIGEMRRTEKLFEKIQREVREAEAGIRRQEFQPTPGAQVCVYCPYNEICPSSKIV